MGRWRAARSASWTAADVFAAGRLDVVGGSHHLLVIKLSGSTGIELWRQERDPAVGFSEATAIAIDSGDDVIVVERLSGDSALVKYDGSTGTEVWRYESGDEAGAFQVAIDGSGDVFAAGLAGGGIASDSDFVMLKVDRATGAVSWRRDIDGSAADYDAALGLAVDPSGDYITAGYFGIRQMGPTIRSKLAVVKLGGLIGTAGPLDGDKLRIGDPGDPNRRKVTFRIRDDDIKAPLPGSPSDPSIAGATVRIFNPITLDEASQHTLAVSVEFGASDRQCAEFSLDGSRRPS
ncbi:MAG: PQQ-binding-like beta-propeller repeat protein [Candidatus Binatia bacterium]|nr:PQQ-binding-like beta-propeller repeat protein [Candidatus Binatia bacterium]